MGDRGPQPPGVSHLHQLSVVRRNSRGSGGEAPGFL